MLISRTRIARFSHVPLALSASARSSLVGTRHESRRFALVTRTRHPHSSPAFGGSRMTSLAATRSSAPPVSLFAPLVDAVDRPAREAASLARRPLIHTIARAALGLTSVAVA